MGLGLGVLPAHLKILMANLAQNPLIGIAEIAAKFADLVFSLRILTEDWRLIADDLLQFLQLLNQKEALLHPFLYFL